MHLVVGIWQNLLKCSSAWHGSTWEAWEERLVTETCKISLQNPLQGIGGKCKKPGAITESATLLKIQKSLGQNIKN